MNTVLVIANVLLVLITLWYAYSTHRSLRLVERQERERARPRVLVSIEQTTGPQILALRVENVGLEPALHLHLGVEPPDLPYLVAAYGTVGRLKIFTSEIPQMARGQKLETKLLNVGTIRDPNMNNVRFTASYLGIDGLKYEDSFSFDLRIYEGLRPLENWAAKN